jgi:hypothetical protein
VKTIGKALFSVLLTLLTLVPLQADAARSTLNPRVRVHGGAVIAEGPSPVGFTFGVDSRASRFIYLDIGGFLNPFSPFGEDLDLENLRAPHLARHGMYILPGLRIPHRQPKAFSWDVTFRSGFGILWTSYVGTKTNPSYGNQPLDADVMTVGGLDFGIRRGAIGLRATGRVLFAWPHDYGEREDPFFYAPQLSLEALYQF